MTRVLLGCINFNNRVFTEIWIKTLTKTLEKANKFLNGKLNFVNKAIDIIL